MRAFNTSRRFGEHATWKVRRLDGKLVLMTDNEYRTIMERTSKNIEDVPSWAAYVLGRIMRVKLW